MVINVVDLLELGINRLAGFELNKERLFAAGLLSLCFRLLEGSCTDDETLVASQTFWILSFNSNVRSEVKSSHHYMQGECNWQHLDYFTERAVFHIFLHNA